MAKRSSARLRERSTTPKRVSLSHDAVLRTPKTAPVRLSALRENDEIPGAFPQSTSPPETKSAHGMARDANTNNTVKFTMSTPTKAQPIRPSAEEMHPQLHHQSTTKPLDEARWLGFSTMAPHTEPPKRGSRAGILQCTPTRNSRDSDQAETPKFRFTFTRDQSLELSPEAKKLMYEKREEAAKIREQMTANGEGREDIAKSIQRRIATPKGKKTRFSEVHMEEFRKMDSIAGHASAFRADPNHKRLHTVDSPTKEMQISAKGSVASTRSLKRSPSKAQLDDATHRSSRSSSLSPTKLSQHIGVSRSHEMSEADEPRAKRARHNSSEAVSVPTTNYDSANNAPSTPVKKLQVCMPSSTIAALATPTQASLARAASVKATKVSHIPTPAPLRSVQVPRAVKVGDQGSTEKQSLLTRSPLKAAVRFDSPKVAAEMISYPLLQQTPSKGLRHGHFADQAGATKPQPVETTQLLSRSPIKSANPYVAHTEGKTSSGVPQSPLLSRSPLKMAITTSSETAASGSAHEQAPIPFLSWSPAKIAIPGALKEQKNAQVGQASPSDKELADRFRLLRKSPVKSILRSPARLYSDDLTKIAAGTHLATPPRYNPSTTAQKSNVGTPNSNRKRVDFSSSTKARYDRVQSDTSSTPSKGPTPPKAETTQPNNSEPETISYPALSTSDDTTPLSPQKRRQTITPADFTFRVDTDRIIFSPSPKAPRTVSAGAALPTIRHVVIDQQPPHLPPPPSATGSKKRKYDFENEKASEEAPMGKKLFVKTKTSTSPSNKENQPDKLEQQTERPAKRAKPSAAQPSSKRPMPAAPPTKKPTRVPTLGVKPRGVKTVVKEGRDRKPTTISQSRLNALSQPKKRG